MGLGIGEGLCEAWAALIMPGHSLEVVRGVALVGVVHRATSTAQARSTSAMRQLGQGGANGMMPAM